MSEPTREFWKRCSNCKSPIAWGAIYQVCSVSTCNRERTGLVFCTVDCWDTHLPMMRHREAWAVERRAPTSEEDAGPPKSAPRRKIVAAAPTPTRPPRDDLDPPPPEEILVVASKLKAYIKARGGMNTSASVLEALSDRVRELCDDAIRSAREHERKTVLDRDF